MTIWLVVQRSVPLKSIQPSHSKMASAKSPDAAPSESRLVSANMKRKARQQNKYA